MTKTFAVAAICLLWACPRAKADGIFVGNLADVANYAVLYSGAGGHNLQITNVTINGNVGVGGTGVVQFNGPGSINGNLVFDANNAGQFHDNNIANFGPNAVIFGQSDLATDLQNVGTFSSTIGGVSGQVNIAISGNQTINASSGDLVTINGVHYEVFNVTSYSEGDGKMVTIVGNGNNVIFNFSANSNVNLGGDVTLQGGLTADNVMWNFNSTGQNIQLNDNASTYTTLAYQGAIVAPNDAISVVNSNLNGRVIGGDSSDMQIVSGDTITMPTTIVSPEPASLLLLGTGLLALGGITRRRFAKN